MLAFSNLGDMLQSAHKYATKRYGNIPRLMDMLQFRFDLAMDEINNPDREPLKLLHSYLRGERAVLNAYNKHRLGTAPSHLGCLNKAAIVGEDVYNPAENLPERLETFPLRFETVQRGYPLPYSELAPIYQDYTDYPLSSSPEPTKPRIKGKDGRSAASRDKLSNAPPSSIPFPNANITLVELITFLPQSVKTWPVIDRLIGAGATTHTITHIINEYRDMQSGTITNNTVYRMMRSSMDKRAKIDPQYKNWSVKKHASITSPPDFNPSSISVAGFTAPGHDATMSVPLKQLAAGVKILPSGADALDLTRCVAYALKYPDEAWVYPHDMLFVLDLLDAGPGVVREEHLDQSAVARHGVRIGRRCDTATAEESGGNTEVSPSLPAKRKRYGSNSADSADVQNSTSRKLSPSKTGRSATSVAASRVRQVNQFVTDADSDDSDAYCGPKRMKKSNLPLRASGRTGRIVGAYSEVVEPEEMQMDIDGEGGE